MTESPPSRPVDLDKYTSDDSDDLLAEMRQSWRFRASCRAVTIRHWLAQKLHALARWLEQIGTEQVCNQPDEWPEPEPPSEIVIADWESRTELDAAKFRFCQKCVLQVDAAGRMTVSPVGIGLGGEERGE